MLGGMEALDQPYMQTGFLEMVRKRGVWLAILFAGQTVTVAVLSMFQAQLEAIVALALFIPLVISCGGNSGSQASTLVTRALALDELEPSDWFQIVRREIVTGLLLGIALGILAMCTVLAWSSLHHVEPEKAAAQPPIGLIAAVITLAVTGVVTWGTLVGSLLPLLLKRANLDPAVASTPLVATLMDTSGMLIYFGFAVALLRQLGG